MEQLPHFTELANQEDLFTYWQQELLLRSQLRQAQSASFPIAVQTAVELDLLSRALYYSGRKDDFFSCLTHSLSNTAALQWLQRAPNWLKSQFLAFLPGYLDQQEMEPSTLQFIIHLYDQTLETGYRSVVAKLNEKQCRFLLSRTANKSLRTLLQSRTDRIKEEQNLRFYGLLADTNLDYSPLDIATDKQLLLQQALLRIEKIAAQQPQIPDNWKGLPTLLDIIDLIYCCGLLADAYYLLSRVGAEYQLDSHKEELLPDFRLVQRFHRLASKIIGTMVLLNYSLCPGDQTVSMYKSAKLDSYVDQRLQSFLFLYETLLASARQDAFLSWETVYAYEEMRRISRPELQLPAFHFHTPPDSAVGEILVKVIRELLPSVPHEAFILSELCRHLDGCYPGLLSQKAIQRLFQGYLLLWKWIPSGRFFPGQMMEQWGPNLSFSLRQEAENIYGLMTDPDSCRRFSSQHTDLFLCNPGSADQQALLGFLLGVMK